MSKPHNKIINSYTQEKSFKSETGETINYTALVLVFDVEGIPTAITTSIKKYDKLVLQVAKNPAESKLDKDTVIDLPVQT